MQTAFHHWYYPPSFRMLLAASLFAVIPHAWAASKTCDVRALGATGDGHTKDTTALQRAIDTCSVPGGGIVHFSAGTYLSAPLDWKSHVRLQLDAGATLLGSPDMGDYAIRQDAPWRRISLLHADHAIDIAITGAGTVDGNGALWWAAQREGRRNKVPEAPRPMLFDLTNSRHILIAGVTIQNSPQYNIMAVLCNGLTVRGVHILNPGRTAPNTDGIDPISTSHVLIEDSTIDTGDDNIAIKSGLVERGDPDVSSTDITIRNCHLLQGHGLSIGSETAGGVRHVRVEHVTFDGTRQGIRIKSARGRGNDIGDFVYRDITMTNVETPIQITAYYTGHLKEDTAQPVTPHTPRFHDITIENLIATGAKQAAVIDGLPESPIRNLVLRNVKISAQTGVAMQYVDVHATKLVIKPASGEPLIEGPGVDLNAK